MSSEEQHLHAECVALCNEGNNLLRMVESSLELLKTMNGLNTMDHIMITNMIKILQYKLKTTQRTQSQILHRLDVARLSLDIDKRRNGAQDICRAVMAVEAMKKHT